MTTPEDEMTPEFLALDDQQAAALFRLHVSRPLGGCQFEGGRMRWWLLGGLRIELTIDGEWRLFVVPTRDAYDRLATTTGAVDG